MAEIYRVEKGSEEWKYKAYDYVRTMRSAADRTFRLNWNSDRTRAKMICRRFW